MSKNLEGLALIEVIYYNSFASIFPTVFKEGFTRTFPRNQDVIVKLKSELSFIKFLLFL